MNDDPISRAFCPLLGLPMWGGMKGQGSMMSFEFGEPRLQISEPIRSKSERPEIRRHFARRCVKPVGEWYLWFYMCEWHINAGPEQIAHSESPDADIEAAIRDLDGQKLIRLEVDPGRGTSRFYFDLGMDLLTQPADADNEEQWLLYIPDRQFVGYRADGHCCTGPTDQPEDEHIWSPLPSERIVCALG